MHIRSGSELYHWNAGIPTSFSDHRQNSHKSFTIAGGQQYNFAVGFKCLKVGGDPFRAMEGCTPGLVTQSLPAVRQAVNYFGPANFDPRSNFTPHCNVRGHPISKRE
jgi:hypothetical protein